MGSPHPPHVPEGLLCAGDTVVTPALQAHSLSGETDHLQAETNRAAGARRGSPEAHPIQPGVGVGGGAEDRRRNDIQEQVLKSGARRSCSITCLSPRGESLRPSGQCSWLGGLCARV